jgi:succinate dehydrogenase / fumarate reductase iron-sulfur subunit
MQAKIRILRYNPEIDEKPHWEEYTVEVEPTDRVVDVLHKIKWFQDGTLTFRRSCLHGICGSDAMLINGRNRLACKTLMREVGDTVTVAPLRGFRVIKDLTIDMKPFFQKYRSVMPYLVNEERPPERERLQSPEARARFDDTTKCILCAACTTACPSFWADARYVGPAAIVQAHRFIFDSRDRAWRERLQLVGDNTGVWRCRNIFNCVAACPREINVTKAIAEVRQAILTDSRGLDESEPV